MPEYSFCETTAAYKWHIRILTAVGKKLNGGADSKTLCDLDPSWDINCPITPGALEAVCSKCRQKYLSK